MASSSDTTSAVTHVDQESLPDWMLPERTRVLTSTKKAKTSGKCVLYWMQRDVRTVDNWALLYASHLAETAKIPLRVAYVLPPQPADENVELPNLMQMRMTERHGTFLLGGLELVHGELEKVGVPLDVLMPSEHNQVGTTVCRVVDQFQPQVVVCDMNPLRFHREWTEEQTAPLLEERKIPLIQVDAHNVVPMWHASPKREVGARTLRPKLHKLFSTFLQPYPEFKGNVEATVTNLPHFDMDAYVDFLDMDSSVKPVAWASKPGTKGARAQFERFLKNGLSKFDSLRNDPNQVHICSSLSPWINHGHISFQSLAMEVKALNKYANGTAAYIEEGLVRRELSDNYVYYTPDHYDSLEAAAGWAQETLQVHSTDTREYLYSLQELEESKTHDDLWNAAQLQLVTEGKMHGFLRMYWAKKILEWTEGPEVALHTAQYFNDNYALDGRDPNGFVGVGWSIMGIHDMGWKERPIFGKIRFMNYAGCKRKFKVADFVARYPGAAENALAAEEKHGKPAATPKAKKKKSGTNKRKSPSA